LGSLEQWSEVQQALTNLTPVLTYDRGGYGLSDPPPANDADAQADELADLATLKAIKLPLVVVGFSSSALIARAFAKRHAALLGGLMLLDPTNPEQIIGVSYKDLYARRVLYERVPLLTLAKRVIGLQSEIGQRGAVPTPAELRAGQILNFPSHWWAGYLEGKEVGKSAEEAQVDWKNLHIPITVLSVAHATGDAEGRERYRLHVRFVQATGAEFINPSGYTHDQVHHDNAFVPEIVRAVAGTVSRVRAQSATPKP
jgi:pimeloyl-ACP methyl ester carboxylesterase